MFMKKVDQLFSRKALAALAATACLSWSGVGYGQVPGKGQASDEGGQVSAQPGDAQPAPQAGLGYPPGRQPRGRATRPGGEAPGGAGLGGGVAGGGVTGAGTMPGMAPGGAAEPSSAAEMLNIALQTNPDLLVARAKVAEAEAELRRVQLDVARRVFRQRQDLENQKAKVARIQKLHASKAATAEDLSEAVNELSALETELQYLMGRLPEMPGGVGPGASGYPGMMPGGMGMMSRMPGAGGMTGMQGMSGMPGFGGTAAMGGGEVRTTKTRGGGGNPAAAEAKDEKLSKALETKISLKVENAPLHDVLKRLQEAAQVKFVVNTSRLAQAGVPLDSPITIDVEDTALSAVLQLVEDLHPPLSFSIRDYGILVTEGPPSARDSMMNMMRSMRGR